MVVESILLLLLLFFPLVKFFILYIQQCCQMWCDVYSLMLKFRSLLILVILSDRVTAILFMILWSIYCLTELLIA